MDARSPEVIQKTRELIGASSASLADEGNDEISRDDKRANQTRWWKKMREI